MQNVRLIENAVHFRPRPQNLPGYHRYSNGQFDAFVHETDVLRTVADWAQRWDRTEIAGRLVGRVYRDDDGFWCVITGAILADFRGGPTTVTTTDEDAAHTSRVLTENHPAEDLMGWFHSHPFGLDNYSSVDRANQAQWGKAYHVGLLVARHLDCIRVHAFVGPESELLGDSYVVPVRRSSASNSNVERTSASPGDVTPPAVHVHQPPARDDFLEVKILSVLIVALVVGILFLKNEVSDQVQPLIERIHKAEVFTVETRSELQQHALQIQHQISDIQKTREESREAVTPRVLKWIAAAFVTPNQSEAPEKESNSTKVDGGSGQSPATPALPNSNHLEQYD
jgi:proteasome lid subunit RPN8/RPN11